MKRQRNIRVQKVQLPEEIIVEILSKLPGKALLRFKSVSKLWKSLISNPNFILSNAGRERAIAGCSTFTTDVKNSKLQRIGFYSVDDELTVVKLPNPVGEVPYSYAGFELFGTCDGLVLFCADRCMYLWNPLTRFCRELSQLNCLVDRFQPKGNYVIASGMCFDKCSDDYKILVVNTPRVVFGGDIGLGKFVCVASLKKRENRMDIGFPYKLSNCASFSEELRSGVLVSGHLHWIVTREMSVEQLIVYFDEAMNQFRELPMPDELVFDDRGSSYCFGLSLLNGCLCMCSLKRPSDCDYNLFVMREYGVKCSWTKLCTISRAVLVPLHTRIPKKLVLFPSDCIMFACDLKKKNCVERIKGQPVSLKDPPLRRTNNSRNRRTRNLRNRGDSNFEPVDLYNISSPLVYVESLASVDLI